MSLKNRIARIEQLKGPNVSEMGPVLVDFVDPETMKRVSRWRVHPGTADNPGRTEEIKINDERQVNDGH